MTELKTFFRIENEKGEGFYCARFKDENGFDNSISHNLKKSEHLYSNKFHPEPDSDSLLVKNLVKGEGEKDSFHSYMIRMKYAFVSIEQLKFWVHMQYVREMMDKYGFRVAKFRAKGYYGDSQAMYWPGTRVDITSFRVTDI